ncbi:hypothetical protein [Streptomyces hygroscopicus]|uniref:hypothetical protein n=1 Tax=Streptomyces hygroscopicus TaxID=1912 RepID=UPI00224077A9|nr:hypothetical protein [Streptomyces hygroscopicus]
MGLYVEAHIRGDLDELWARIQDPAQRRRWHLRLTEIHHMPCTEGGRPDGTRNCALRFSSPHPLSPIAEGSGYWRCVPEDDGVRFLTGYGHRPRRGRAGALADRVLVRPLLGWATAWSVDRLRLWLERGITPERARLNWLAELAVRALVLTAGGTGFGAVSVIRFFGSLAPTVAYLCPLLLALVISVALFAPPSARTPAARRCLRTGALVAEDMTEVPVREPQPDREASRRPVGRLPHVSRVRPRLRPVKEEAPA